MSKITNLQELYVDELKDLWSANDQMVRAEENRAAGNQREAKVAAPVLTSRPRQAHGAVERVNALTKRLKNRLSPVI